MIVLNRSRMRSTISLCLIVLTAFDTGLLVSALPTYLPLAFCRTEYAVCGYLRQGGAYMYPISLIMHTGSVWMCVHISINRFYAVRFPLKERFYCTRSKSKRAIVIILIFSIIHNIPTFFEIKFNNETQRVEGTEMRKDFYYQKIYKLGMTLIVMLAVPLSIIMVLNFLLIRTLGRAATFRKSTSESRVSGGAGRRRRALSQHEVTVTAIAIVLMFFVASLVPFVNNVIENFATKEFRNAFFARTCVYLGNFAVILNSSLNVVVYCAAGGLFREEIASLFRCFGGGNAKSIRSQTITMNRSAMNLPSPSRFEEEFCEPAYV